MLQCPTCRQSLNPKIEAGIEIDICPRQCGVWLDRGELEALAKVRSKRKFPKSDRQLQGLIKDSGKCPRCVTPTLESGNVQQSWVKRCTQCRGVFVGPRRESEGWWTWTEVLLPSEGASTFESGMETLGDIIDALPDLFGLN